ncbi:MAG: hypothetical protein M1497_10030, partial [Nitrospirae bacterium]|nr:hypothetical protein [Nitrospirota bacterium]
MNALIVPRGESLVEQALAHLAGEGRDYSSSLVVFPGKRPSHFLRKALAAKVGSAFIPPVILSMDEFVDSVSEELQQGRRLETIDAVALLYGIHRKARRPLGGDGFMSPDSFFSLGLKIYRDIEELTIEGIGARKVREIESLVEGGIPEQTRERFQSLSFFYEEFYRECASLGFSTRSGRYRLAADRIDEAGPVGYRRIIFAGFFALTHAEKVLFRKLLSRDETVFLFQEGPGIEEKLRGLGVSAREKAKGAAEPALYFYSSPDTHGQTLALGKVLMTKTAGGGALDERTVIVLPSSETLFPLVRQGLSAIPEESYNVSLGYPLHRTPVFGFLNNLMELVASMDGERLYVPDYLKFVLHPYTKNMYFEGKSETTRILFHAVEEELLTRRMKTFVTLEEIEGNETFFRNVITMLPEEEKGITAARLQEHLRAIHRSTIGKFLSFEDVSDFAKKCIEVLIYVFNNSTARLHPLFSPFSEAFVTNLELLPRSLMREIAFAERSSYFTFFRKYLMTCHAPFSGTPVKGLQVLG